MPLTLEEVERIFHVIRVRRPNAPVPTVSRLVSDQVTTLLNAINFPRCGRPSVRVEEATAALVQHAGLQISEGLRGTRQIEAVIMVNLLDASDVVGAISVEAQNQLDRIVDKWKRSPRQDVTLPVRP